MPRMVMTYGELPEHIRRLNPRADPAHRAAGRRCPEPEPGQQRALDRSAPAPALVDGLPRPCVVRITRVGTRRYDDDNLVGGCKELRDAVAAALGLPGDAEEDGVRFEYRQETGRHPTVRIDVESSAPASARVLRNVNTCRSSRRHW